MDLILTPGSWLTWDRIDLFLAVVPVLLLIYPIISYLHEFIESRAHEKDFSSGWQVRLLVSRIRCTRSSPSFQPCRGPFFHNQIRACVVG